MRKRSVVEAFSSNTLTGDTVKAANNLTKGN